MMMMSISLVGLSAAPPVASLSLSASRAGGGALGFGLARRAPHSHPLINSSFVAAPSTASPSFSSSMSGLSLGISFSFNKFVPQKRRGLQVRAGKATLCMTKRNRSRKSLARTHGFRRRMRTTTGRAVLKRRRAKGRKVLCTKSYPSSGKRS